MLCFDQKVSPQREHVNLPGLLRRISLAFRIFTDETDFWGTDDGTVGSPNQHGTAEEDEAAATVSHIGSFLSSSKELRKVLEVDVWLFFNLNGHTLSGW